jgi:hypothetical protein
MQWALNGVVATVPYREAVPVIQHRGVVADAGSNDLDIISMGVDKVFVALVDGSRVCFLRCK